MQLAGYSSQTRSRYADRWTMSQTVGEHSQNGSDRIEEESEHSIEGLQTRPALFISKVKEPDSDSHIDSFRELIICVGA
ncbi:hypothetical protein CcaCcLH18_13381 [Colletotrichum camelliae]|nr:hypothetical protein CcaCcLH18_13381 [Colletotrichum camelliae]